MKLDPKIFKYVSGNGLDAKFEATFTIQIPATDASNIDSFLQQLDFEMRDIEETCVAAVVTEDATEEENYRFIDPFDRHTGDDERLDNLFDEESEDE
jgi:hypothetical protein